MKFETKFDPGQTVWFLYQNNIISRVIDEVRASACVQGKYRTVYEIRISDLLNDTIRLYDDKIFATKQDLIESL